MVWYCTTSRLVHFENFKQIQIASAYCVIIIYYSIYFMMGHFKDFSDTVAVQNVHQTKNELSSSLWTCFHLLGLGLKKLGMAACYWQDGFWSFFVLYCIYCTCYCLSKCIVGDVLYCMYIFMDKARTRSWPKFWTGCPTIVVLLSKFNAVSIILYCTVLYDKIQYFIVKILLCYRISYTH